MTKKTFFIAGALVLFFLPSRAFCDETLTITTYYPSPYGTYREMRADQMSVGSGYRSSSLSDGMLFVENKVGVGTDFISSGLTVDIHGYVGADAYCDRDGNSCTTNTCPSGFVKIENAGETLGCMQINQGASMDWWVATRYCYEQYGGRLPTLSEWYIAASYYSGQINGMLEGGDRWEWTSDSAGNANQPNPETMPLFMGAGGSTAIEYFDRVQANWPTRPVRCWVDR